MENHNAKLSESSQKRTNGVFLTELRKEIMDTQERRGRLIRLKLTFISSFFGLGTFNAFKINDITFQTVYLFYIIPIVALIFDLNIMGEDFGIKRAAKFIRERMETPSVEKDWELYVHLNRDKFTKVGFIISAILVCSICFFMVIKFDHPSTFVLITWLAISSLTIWINVFYSKIRNWLNNEI
jgi:hypothetical protein